ncbi:universal stress protein [Streptomyces sp. NPDC006733]|uniref:universal stress protein n=1 Tax=Streptomyces sp. NPDC006733 TaxID=3155460 RepID=UPI0033D8CD35
MPQHATGPVRRVVVGVDGSKFSTAALRWAMSYAQLTGCTVEAITTWQNPDMHAYSFGWAPGVIDISDIAVSIQKSLDEAIAGEREHFDQPVEVLGRVVEGHPAEVLLAAAAGAQLLTVGTRGHGTIAGMLLGSVSQHCVQHAPCPVVVVPE